MLALIVVGCGDAGQPSELPPMIIPEGAQHWSFDTDPTGAPPLGFDCPVGEWVVERATSGGMAVQRAVGADDDFNLAIATDAAAGDLQLGVRVQAVSGEIDQGGGLVWRLQSPRDYYIARWNPLERNYRVYTVKDGVRRQLDSAQTEADPDAAHELWVRMQGDQIQCLLDGELLLEVVDSTFPKPGRVGLWTKADAVTRFDDLLLQVQEGDQGG